VIGRSSFAVKFGQGVEIVESRDEEGRKGTEIPFLRDQLKCAFGLADSNLRPYSLNSTFNKILRFRAPFIELSQLWPSITAASFAEFKESEMKLPILASKKF
jgi:hypothetical protein